MRISSMVLAASLAAVSLPAQNVADVGLMMDGGILTVIYGQSCGTFTCVPFQAGTTGAGTPHNVYVYGAPQQFYVLAADIDSNQPCIQFPGVGNMLMLSQPVTLAFGYIGLPSLTGVCLQGRGQYVLQFPIGTPIGVAYRIQALAISNSQAIPAFTVTIRATTA